MLKNTIDPQFSRGWTLFLTYAFVSVWTGEILLCLMKKKGLLDHAISWLMRRSVDRERFGSEASSLSH
ncbi:MAG: hypothetical protein LBF76_02505 [Holosporales bacterium]|nr:hypothetical protein [Holosporales bacterium]